MDWQLDDLNQRQFGNNLKEKGMSSYFPGQIPHRLGQIIIFTDPQYSISPGLQEP